MAARNGKIRVREIGSDHVSMLKPHQEASQGQEIRDDPGELPWNFPWARDCGYKASVMQQLWSLGAPSQ